MANQQSIKVDAGSGSPVDFAQLPSSANFRQVVSIGDPNTDAQYATVDAQGVNVHGTFTVSGSLPSGSNTLGSFSLIGTLPAGSNTLGTITIGDASGHTANVSASGNLNVSVNAAIAAGSNTLGTVSITNAVPASAETGTVFNGNTPITPSYSAISFAASGNNVVIGTIASKRIRVLALNFIVSTATGVYMQDSVGSTLWAGSGNTGQFAANAGVVLPFNPVGWFQTGSGNALVMNLSTASSVGGSLTYIQV